MVEAVGGGVLRLRPAKASQHAMRAPPALTASRRASTMQRVACPHPPGISLRTRGDEGALDERLCCVHSQAKVTLARLDAILMAPPKDVTPLERAREEGSRGGREQRDVEVKMQDVACGWESAAAKLVLPSGGRGDGRAGWRQPRERELQTRAAVVKELSLAVKGGQLLVLLGVSLSRTRPPCPPSSLLLARRAVCHCLVRLPLLF